jgi:Zn-dependent M28 family amino/carboxypeptidase
MQVEMGPRAPGTPAHSRCASYLESELRRFTPHVRRQQPPIITHDGKRFTLQNIIASFNPDAPKRILLCAHWDSRPRAEMDSKRPGEAILAANDGASGVAVLLEVARNLSQKAPPCGVDIVLFDLEDYGESSAENSYCLGSQYWARSPHKAGYRAEYGILLDMVGGKGARFFREGTSRTYALGVVEKVWGHAQRLGYGSWFVNQDGNAITDDHYYINKIAGLPTIDIIEMDPGSETGFGHYWHTHNDNLSVIDKSTLHSVGHTILFTVFQE